MNLGFFNDLAESRVKQILNKTIGFEVPVDLIISGNLDSPTLSINGYFLNLHPFYAAVNSGGIFFIHKAEVCFAITWDNILNIKKFSPEDFYKDILELHFYHEVTAVNQVYKLEYPYCYWHKMKIKIFKEEQKIQFLDKYIEIKNSEGIFTPGLEIFQEWIEGGVVREPVTKEKYLELNKNWADEETRDASWVAWGELNDAVRFFFYVGRNVAIGKLPSSLLDVALKEWEKYDLANSKFTGTTNYGNEKLLELMNKTKDKVKNIQENFNLEEWKIELIETQIDEWQSTMVMSKRLACIRNYEGQKRIYNDFYS